jgi:transcriptional/translational regulatory protein YebC/TACO1
VLYPPSTVVDLKCLLICGEHPDRTTANIKSYFNKSEGGLVAPGSLEFMFERKSVFHLEKNNVDIEKIELFLIDYGLEEIKINKEEIIIMIKKDLNIF